jgi:cobalt-zinc-cadmium efflux system outer membrane protein
VPARLQVWGLSAIVVLVCLLDAVGRPSSAHAQEHAPAPSPSPEASPSRLSLADALRLARTRGFDVLAASAAIRGAEADLRSAGALPNPSLSLAVARTLACEGGACDPLAYGVSVSVSDQGLLEGALSRKRALRAAVARLGVEASRADRADVERLVVSQVKTQYVQAAAAQAQLAFKRDVAATLERSVAVNRVRYPRVIDEGQLARVEQESLKAEQEVARARRDLRQQQIELLVLVGATGLLPEIDVDTEVLRRKLPETLERLDRASLVREAIARRPDRLGAIAREARADAQIDLVKRLRVPDVSLGLQYNQQGAGANAPQPASLGIAATLPLPLLYQQQGEIRRAEADREVAVVARRRVDSVVSGDVESALNAFTTAREIVQRYESSLLDRAKRAREITEIQYGAGSATLTDMLDAQRSFVQASSDYNAELVFYWTSVFQLEQALGRELVP